MSTTRAFGFHTGERAVQQEEGVRLAAQRLEGMLDRAQLSIGVARFLAERTFVAITARDDDGRLWTSPLTGRAGFAEVQDATSLLVHATPTRDDPLAGLAAGQPIGLLAIDYSRRRRFRLNGTLSTVGVEGLGVEVEEAYGNCPQYIPQRTLDPVVPTSGAAGADTHAGMGVHKPGPDRLTSADVATIAAADTFILGTTHPVNGNDASHRGGPAGFVRVSDGSLWWPDYAGNNMFNSFGNLHEAPESALLFMDFDQHSTLQLNGSAQVRHVEPGSTGDDGHTGRRVVFTVDHVARSALPLDSTLISEYALNPPVAS